MTPAVAIGMLKRQLAAKGQTIRLQRTQASVGVVTEAAGVDVRALVRGYKPEELGTGIQQQDSKVIMGAGEIIAAGWTSGRAAPQDSRVPAKNNRLLIAGRLYNVEAAVGIYIGAELVRIEIQARG